MSKDIFVLAPNGRKHKVHCSPDTNMLQVLEEVCTKLGYRASDYDLKHHNTTLDLSTILRFSNLPNRALLEMVETERVREEANVTIGLQLEDGERRTADFSPQTCLFDIITQLAPEEITSIEQPTIMYMRREITGLEALKENTLRHLGLIKGGAVLRLMNKPEESRQANVSAVYRRPLQNKKPESMETDAPTNESDMPGPSSDNRRESTGLDPIQLIKKVIHGETSKSPKTNTEADDTNVETNRVDKHIKEPVLKKEVKSSNNSGEFLERRLKIDEEVTFLGERKAVAFRQPEQIQDELEDLPDDFYELSVEEVRRLYKDLQQNRIDLENSPLVPASDRAELERQISTLKLKTYKNVVVRIQFPDHMILQGVFCPHDTIEDIANFVKSYLRNPDFPFHIFTTPFKEKYDPKTTLFEAGFVPCVHMHFKWSDDNIDVNEPCLKEEVYSNQTESEAASILASKYRAPCRRKADDDPGRTPSATVASTSKNTKVPRWFKK